MARLRCTAVQARPAAFLDVTSVTLREFPQFVPPFETAFHAPRAAWRLDGKLRLTRRCTGSKHWPLPTPEARLCFMLVFLKTAALQVVHGRLCGMGQTTAHPWMHGLCRKSPKTGKLRLPSH
jgi:hypothetical protein